MSCSIPGSATKAARQLPDAREGLGSLTGEPDRGAASEADLVMPERHAVRRRRRRLPLSFTVGVSLVGLFAGIALLSFAWTPYDPLKIVVTDRLLPPGTRGYLLGTDKLGRDVVSQLMAGARNSLYVSLLATTAAVFIGTALGLAIAGSGLRVRTISTRFIDMWGSLPGILIALVLAASTGPGNRAAITAIIFWFIPIAARTTIGPARQVLALDYVEAAFAYGRRRWHVLTRHVLPNIGPLVIVLATILFASAILIEAALAFLGVGAQPPTASWGRLLQESQPLLERAPTLMFFPGVAIVLTVLGFNLLGDGLRILLDPQQKTSSGAW
jgi:peptide/nickel transport system permease protein